jgi:hypothetical protein
VSTFINDFADREFLSFLVTTSFHLAALFGFCVAFKYLQRGDHD